MKIGLYRIIGNDLDGRHGDNQSINNIKFIIENESNFKNCNKYWVLNRIVNKFKLNMIKDFLIANNQKFLEIEFSINNYRKIQFNPFEIDGGDLNGPNPLISTDSRINVIAHIALVKSKALYSINNNGARNFALIHGKQRFDWTLPWDGNCIMNDKCWDAMVEAFNLFEHAQYVYVPMCRIINNQDFHNIGVEMGDDEPQLCFRYDSTEMFNESLMYGFKPKVELLKRLDIRGIWDNWNLYYPWNELKYKRSADSHKSFKASTVVRLSDESSQKIDQVKIAYSREIAIYNLIKNQDINLISFSNKSIKEIIIDGFDVKYKKNNIFNKINVEVFTNKITGINLTNYYEDLIKNFNLINKSNFATIGFYCSGLFHFVKNNTTSQIIKKDDYINYLIKNYDAILNLANIRNIQSVYHVQLNENNFDDLLYLLEINISSIIFNNHSRSYDLFLQSIRAVYIYLENNINKFQINLKVSNYIDSKIFIEIIIFYNYFQILNKFLGINTFIINNNHGFNPLKKYIEQFILFTNNLDEYQYDSLSKIVKISPYLKKLLTDKKISIVSDNNNFPIINFFVLDPL